MRSAAPRRHHCPASTDVSAAFGEALTRFLCLPPKQEVMEKYEVYRDSVDGLPSCQLEVQLYQKKIQDLADNREKLAGVLKEVCSVLPGVTGVSAWDLLSSPVPCPKEAGPAAPWLCAGAERSWVSAAQLSPGDGDGGLTDLTCCCGFQRQVAEVLNSCSQLLEVLLQVT